MKDLKKIIHESLGRVLLERNENETVESLAKKIMQEGKLKKALSKLKPSMFGDEFSFADNVVNHMVADYVEHPLYDKLYDYLNYSLGDSLFDIYNQKMGSGLFEQMAMAAPAEAKNTQSPAKSTKEKKKEEVKVPENCFGGPKKQSGGLVALIQVLMKDHDRNGERAVEEIKRFSEGKSKPDPKEVVQILEKYNKHKYLGYAGCF
jgi:hypothetical protein